MHNDCIGTRTSVNFIYVELFWYEPMIGNSANKKEITNANIREICPISGINLMSFKIKYYVSLFLSAEETSGGI